VIRVVNLLVLGTAVALIRPVVGGGVGLVLGATFVALCIRATNIWFRRRGAVEPLQPVHRAEPIADDDMASVSDPKDRMGAILASVYHSGERKAEVLGLNRFEKYRLLGLEAWAKQHPILGSAIQGLVFALGFTPFFLFFAILVNGWLVPSLLFGGGFGLVVGIWIYPYNRYVHRHGEPWKQKG
jgi:hypothetical protein